MVGIESVPGGVAVDLERAHADVQVDCVDRIVVIEILALAFLKGLLARGRVSA